LIPLRDCVASRRVPFITVLLIIANGYFFIKELLSGEDLGAFVNMFAVIPVLYTGGIGG